MPELDNDNLRLILEGCKSKNEKSQERLYKQFFGYAMGIALVYLNSKDDAREIVNDSFMKVFSEIAHYNPEMPFKSWFRKIVVNTCIDKYRKNVRLRKIIEPDLEVPNDTGVISNLTVEDILNLLNQLPEIYKVVFVLYEIEGFSHDEIAQKLNLSESSSRVYLTRAKRKLRELFPVYF